MTMHVESGFFLIKNRSIWISVFNKHERIKSLTNGADVLVVNHARRLCTMYWCVQTDENVRFRLYCGLIMIKSLSRAKFHFEVSILGKTPTRVQQQNKTCKYNECIWVICIFSNDIN